MKKYLVRYGIKLGIMIVAVLLFLKWINIAESIDYLSNVNLGYFFIALGVILIANLIKGFRFHVLTNALKLDLSLLRVMLVNSMCIIVGRVTPGRIGEAVKIMWLDRKKSDLTFCFLVEKIIDALLVLLIALLGMGIFADYVNSYLLFGGILAVGIFGLFHIDKILKFITKKDILEDKWFMRNVRKLSFMDWFWVLFSSAAIRVGALSLAILITIALNIDASWVMVMVIWNLAIILGQVSAIPGGLGVREAGYTYLLNAHAGVVTGLAGIAAALITTVDLIVETFLAIVCWIFLKLLDADKKKK